jgi:chemotaxis protein methyltransferase CheR
LASESTAEIGEGEITPEDFQAIARMLRDAAGIELGSNKRELVFGRLKRRLRVLGLANFAEYRAYLAQPDSEAERGEMVNALTTNLTSFFRESHHFTHLAKDVLPNLLKSNGNRRLRIWSSACSSGEEPYSIAMVLHKALQGKPGWDARILATDIDTNMIARGQAGVYEADRIDTIPAEYGKLLIRADDDRVIMSDQLKQRIAFRPLNLLGEWPMRGPFDVVFCRNVVIYFDKTTQRTLFKRFADILSPNGWLFIGHSESLLGVSDRFEHLGRTIYRKIS